MKNEVLDDILISNSNRLHNLLKPNEKVIWEGKPSAKFNWRINSFDNSVSSTINNIISWIFLLVLSGISLMFFLLIFWETSNETKFLLLMGFIFYFISLYQRGFKRRKTRYIISNNRILFQLWKKEEVLFENWRLGRCEYFSIPFSEIKNLVIIEEKPKRGVIFLAVKNPRDIPFDTYSFSDGQRRHQPTLELIENVEEVGNFIKKGIQGKL